MTITKFVCDRCSQAITEDRSELLCESGLLRRVRGESVDLCARCALDLTGWLSNPTFCQPPTPAPLSARVRVAAVLADDE